MGKALGGTGVAVGGTGVGVGVGLGVGVGEGSAGRWATAVGVGSIGGSEAKAALATKSAATAPTKRTTAARAIVGIVSPSNFMSITPSLPTVPRPSRP